MTVAGVPQDTKDHQTSRGLRRLAAITGCIGGPLFLLGVLLHPGRDGAGIRAAGQVYGLTHDLQALSLVLIAVSLATGGIPIARSAGRGALSALLTALVGQLLWMALIAIDGSRNPVMARFAPGIVHTPADLDAGVAVIVLPALVLFPLGNVLLARLLLRRGASWPGLLIGAGALIHTAGGLSLFIAGPHSPIIQILEVVGALPYALGIVLLSRSWVRGGVMLQ